MSATSKSADSKCFALALRCGRLANRMVLFANFVAYAEEHGHRVVNFTFHSYAEYFPTLGRDIYCSYPPPPRQSWMDVVPGVAHAIRKTRIFYHFTRYFSLFNEMYSPFGNAVVTIHEDDSVPVVPLESPAVQEPIRAAQLVLVYGWRYRAPELVRRHAEKIRAFFRPAPEHEEAAARSVAALREKAEIIVGVHVRRGDYQGWKGGNYFFDVPRYADWMRETAALFPGRKVAFLICSNEPRQPEEFAGLTVDFGPNTAVGDLYALAGCDYIVGPLSSFTQWASFYGNKPLFHLRDKAARIALEHFSVSFLDEVP